VKIIGIGIDICRNERIKNLINQYGEKFLSRVFHLKEIESCNKRHSSAIDMIANFYAKRFAAKEAFVKALGTGFNGDVKKNEIAILNDEKSGKPEIYLFGSTAKHINASIKSFVSISDEVEFSIANVLLVEC
jgi:holo-[acyl-carrier protein] synthase